jgi:hypothetical protein
MKIFWMVLKLLKAGIDLIIRDYYMTFSISALVSARDSHIKPEVFFSILFFDILCLTPLHRHRKLNSGTNIDIWRQILLLALRTNNQHWLPAQTKKFRKSPTCPSVPAREYTISRIRLLWPAFVFLWIFHYCQ